MPRAKKQASSEAERRQTRETSPNAQTAGKIINVALSSAALDRSIGYSLRRAQFSTYAAFDRAMKWFDVRPSQFAVLVLIRANPGLTQSRVCTALGIQKTNFVALLDKLEARGLTERRKIGGDRRSSALHLTPYGETFVASMEQAHAEMEASLTQRLGMKRTRELLVVLHEFSSKEPAIP